MKTALFAVVLAAALPVAAQQPPAKPAPSASPQISELYQVKLENLNLRAQMLQQQFNESTQMQQIRSEYVALVNEIQKAYPGYRWDGHALVKQPADPPLAGKSAGKSTK